MSSNSKTSFTPSSSLLIAANKDYNEDFIKTPVAYRKRPRATPLSPILSQQSPSTMIDITSDPIDYLEKMYLSSIYGENRLFGSNFRVTADFLEENPFVEYRLKIPDNQDLGSLLEHYPGNKELITVVERIREFKERHYQDDKDDK